jgi:precorrin-3B C17-methyltransferase
MNGLRGTAGSRHDSGILTIVGTGPGSREEMTGRSLEALRAADTIVGYPAYIRLLEKAVPELLKGKDVFVSGMRKESERVEYALEQVRAGKRVCLVSGGDPGVYGLAGLVLELCSTEEIHTLGIIVLPGVTAATAAAARLGAPLMHDFAVISLSDLLTPRNLIEKRLSLAAEGDFVTVIYNPKSSKRSELFERLPSIFLHHRSPDTPVGIVHHAGREDEEVQITTIGGLEAAGGAVHMGTTIIIGNSETFRKGVFMVTPRGYKVEK